MNNPSAALSHWQALHAQSIAMLNLAHSGQWDALIEQEMHYVQLVEKISQTPIMSCPPAQVEQARALLEKNRWRLASSVGVSQDIDSYRAYIQQSRGESPQETAPGSVTGTACSRKSGSFSSWRIRPP